MQNVENLIHVCAHAHTHAQTQAFVQDRMQGMHLSADTYWRGSWALRLLYDISTAKTDTIYHRPLSTETFITS